MLLVTQVEAKDFPLHISHEKKEKVMAMLEKDLFFFPEMCFIKSRGLLKARGGIADEFWILPNFPVFPLDRMPKGGRKNQIGFSP